MPANAFKMDLQGVKDLHERLVQAPQVIQQEAQATINEGTYAISAEAKQRAPVRYGLLKNLISFIKAQSSADGYTSEVISAANYSAYVEFGTGTKVSVPADLEEYAIQFKGTKAVAGMKAQPFFFPAAKRIFPIIEDKMQKIIDKI